ncbi:unnamed protein product [Arabidopsis thaliana]|uniref:(thale cress) hypothetical protein n=1 Tax=Arabidopsis thaliana TaxID=3702 RepID=A0A7G2FFG8_ARATH|nr:unnamed protein product [Arabidopsis thaliana]
MIRCKKLDNISLSRISKMEGVHCLQITRGDEDVSGDSIVNIRCYPHSDDYTKQETMRLSCRVEGKQNGLTIQYGSSVHLLPTPHRYTEHVYIFEASFSLGECNSPEAESELVFDFKVHDYFWAIKECGLQLLELPHAHGDD